MAKIVLIECGKASRQFPLLKERTTIGRRLGNDIVLPDMAVSGEHAVILNSCSDSILQDLNSTNGTAVNGRLVKEHCLQHEDVIELGKYRLKYLVKSETSDLMMDLEGDGPRQPIACPADEPKDEKESQRLASIEIIDGPNSGKTILLAKAFTTIGGKSGEIAVITADEVGYRIVHVEGNARPIVNGVPIGEVTRRLAHGDIIEVMGTRMSFAFPQ